MRISFCSNDVCSREYEELTVIYDLRNKMILKLEAVAADIWHYIYQNNNVEFDDIVNYIVNIYECEEETVSGDIEAFLIELFEIGIIQFDNKYNVLSEDKSGNTQNEIDDFEGQIIQELQSINQLYSATLEMTYTCNEKCIHCYAHESDNNDEISLVDITKYREVIDELYRMKCMHLSFTGGDPFMYRDFLNVYKYAREKGFVCDIFTNALYLADHEDVLQEIVSTRPRAFYISLYGANATTHERVTGIEGSFEKTISVVRKLKEFGISVVFNIMILSVNYKEIDDIITLAKTLEAEYRVSMSIIYTNSGSDSPMEYFVNDKEIIKKVLKTVNKNMYSFDIAIDNSKDENYLCGAGVTSLSISPDGIIYPCISLKNKLGNIYEDSIDDVWNGNRRKELLASLRWENTIECKDCTYQSKCPHCAGISQAETGSCFTCNTCDRIIAECIYETEQ